MKIAVIGSAGFVGTHLVKILLNKEHHIQEIDIKSGCDITDLEQVRGINKFDLAIHLAGKSFVPQSYQHPNDFYYTNYAGTLNVLELCRKYKARLIFFSSYIYGTPQYLPIDEDHPIVPFNPYADSKFHCEQLCRGYNKYFGINTIIFRPFNIYGAGQNPNFLISSLLKQLKSGLISIKDPTPRRDYIFIDDVIRAITKAINYTDTDFDIFNIGSGSSISVIEIVNYLNSLYDNKLIVEITGETRQNEIYETVANIDKIKIKMDWHPKVSFFEGLDRIINN